MTLIVRLIAKYALWIYVLCALGIVFYLRAALAARREGTQAIFSLERETAAKRVYRSSGMTLVLLLIVVGVYTLSHYVDLPPITATPPEPETATPVAATPTRRARTPTPNAQSATPEPTPTRRPRVTVFSPPTVVQETPTTQTAPPPCPHANVQVRQPGLDQVIDAGIEVVGTAQKDRFDRYEFKFKRRDQPDEWHWVKTFRTPVTDGNLGFWPTAHLPPGQYYFMLIAIDETGNSQECVVPVLVQH